MKIKRITPGFVIQTYDSETGKCLEQCFIASDQVDYEDEHGNSVDDSCEDHLQHHPFDMVQP